MANKKTNKRSFLSGAIDWIGGGSSFVNTSNYSNPNQDLQMVKSVGFSGWGYTGDTALTEETVLTIPAVKSAMDAITQTISTLPISLYKFDSNNAPQEIKGDERVAILNGDTNDVLTGTAYKQKIAKDLVLYGQSVTMIDRPSETSNKVQGLYPLDTERLIVEVFTQNGYKYYPEFEYNALNSSFTMDGTNAINIIRNSDDGVTGQGILQTGSDILQLALSQYQYEYNLLNSGAMPSGVLQFQNKINSEVLEQARQNFNKAYSGYKNHGSVIVLEGGAEYTPVQIDPNRLQLDVSKTDMLGQIARLFNIPETMINAKANKYNSNEQNNIQFFQFCLKPILDAITSAFNKYLLLEKEKNAGYYFDFNTDSIFLNTLDEKVTSYSKLFDDGLMTYNETRNKLGLGNSASGDDFIKFGLGNVLVNQTTGQATVFNTMQADNHQGINNQDPGSNKADNMPQPDTSNQPTTASNQQNAKTSKQTKKTTKK